MHFNISVFKLSIFTFELNGQCPARRPPNFVYTLIISHDKLKVCLTSLLSFLGCTNSFCLFHNGQFLLDRFGKMLGRPGDEYLNLRIFKILKKVVKCDLVELFQCCSYPGLQVEIHLDYFRIKITPHFNFIILCLVRNKSLHGGLELPCLSIFLDFDTNRNFEQLQFQSKF